MKIGIPPLGGPVGSWKLSFHLSGSVRLDFRRVALEDWGSFVSAE